MLTHLSIQGLAIIESLAIEFDEGFNVITGETGAGKSILIKALNLLLGSKASPDAVRAGREFAQVTGQFSVPMSHKAIQVLEVLGIHPESHMVAHKGKKQEETNVIVRRSISNKGRSQAWINDVPVTLSALKDLAEALIDVFAQHETHRLLDAHHHTAFVDQFVKDRGLAAQVAEAAEKVHVRVSMLSDLAHSYRSKMRDLDYLQFRCEELAKFAPSVEDYVSLKETLERTRHSHALVMAMQKAQALVDESVDGGSLTRPLRELVKVLEHASRQAPQIPQLNEMASMAGAAESAIEEMSFQIGKFGASLEGDESDIDAKQERLAGYQSLLRKFGVTDAEALIAEYVKLQEDLSAIESAAKNAESMIAEIKQLTSEYEGLAALLTKERAGAVSRLKKAVESEMHGLAMPGALLSVDFIGARHHLESFDVSCFGSDAQERWQSLLPRLEGVGTSGKERAQFMLASNAGEQALPLHRIASGGELSRIMLALKKALAAGADTCILVFDEVDTGISGRVADIVGGKMRELADHFQVVCISHLPQVAAYADSHFRVHKFGKSERTESTITKLSKQESAEEIARLLSGTEVTKTSLANAKSLIEKARSL